MKNSLPLAISKTLPTPNTTPVLKRKAGKESDNNQMAQSKTIRCESNILSEMIPAKNETGTNSCFINVIFHLLYHAKIFRNYIWSYKQMRVHLFIEIQELFMKYKELQMQTPSHLGNSAIDVSDIRNELSKLFPGYHQGTSGDPIDVFLNIMTAIHSYQVNSSLSEDNSAICKPLCPAHYCFALKLHEEIFCSKCNKKTNNVYDNNYYVYEVYMWEIMNTIKNKPFQHLNKLLFNIINTVTSIFDNCIPFCKCRNQSGISKAIILNDNPHYLMIHLTWDSTSPPLVDLCNIYTIIPLTATNNSLFKLSEKTSIITYELKTVITYYNGHYTSCFRSDKVNKWFFIDDMIIKEFSSWTLMMKYVVKNHYHPIALCYEISKTQNKYEHINQIEYQELYSYCCSKDKSVDWDNNKSPFNVVERKESTNSFMVFKKRSGMFNRYSNTQGESSTSLIPDDFLFCSNCNKQKSINLIKCDECGKQLTKPPSNTSNDNNHWHQSYYLENGIKNVISIKQTKGEVDNNDIQIKKVNKFELLKEGHCSGIKDSDSDFGKDIKECQTNVGIFDGNSSNEAERGEIEDEIQKRPTKEIELNFKKAERYVLKSPIKELKNPSNQPNHFQSEDIAKQNDKRQKNPTSLEQGNRDNYQKIQSLLNPTQILPLGKKQDIKTQNPINLLSQSETIKQNDESKFPNKLDPSKIRMYENKEQKTNTLNKDYNTDKNKQNIITHFERRNAERKTTK